MPAGNGLLLPVQRRLALVGAGEGRAGRRDRQDLRQRWATMASVKLNNTLQEDWQAHPDSHSQWSHCAVAPLFVTHMSLAGIRPLAPGFKRVEIRPQLADLADLELTAHTVVGPIVFKATGTPGDRNLTAFHSRQMRSRTGPPP